MLPHTDTSKSSAHRDNLNGRVTGLRFLARGLLFSLLHFAVCVALIMIFDELWYDYGEYPPPGRDSRVFDLLLKLDLYALLALCIPLVWLAYMLLGVERGHPMFLLFVLMNAALWGFGISFIWCLVSRRASARGRAPS